MKQKPVLLVLLVSLSLGIFSWVFYRSPYLAVYELNRAVETKDLALLYRRIDFNALYNSALDALATKELSEAREAPDLLDKLSSQVTAGLGKVTSGNSIHLIKHEFETEFQRDRHEWTEIASNLPKTTLRSFFHDIKDVKFEDVVHVDDGVMIKAQVTLLKLDKTYTLTLRMTRADSLYWRISSFEGLSSLLTLYEDDRAKAVKEHNLAFETLAREKLPFFGESRVESDNGGLSSLLHLEFLFQNKFNRAVSLIVGRIQDKQSPSEISADFDSQAILIEPGEKKVFLVKKEQFLNTVDRVGVSASLDFQYERVRFLDGEELALARDFDEIKRSQ